MSGVLIEKVIMLKKVTCLPFGNLISTFFPIKIPTQIYHRLAKVS